jgi:hypothetical protein
MAKSGPGKRTPFEACAPGTGGGLVIPQGTNRLSPPRAKPRSFSPDTCTSSACESEGGHSAASEPRQKNSGEFGCFVHRALR